MSQFEDSCQLEISRVYPEDEGEYTCVATNGGGTVSCTAMLTLDGESGLLTLHKCDRCTMVHLSCCEASRQQMKGSELTFAFIQRPFWCTPESFLFWG